MTDWPLLRPPVYSVTRPRPIDQYVLNLEQKRLRQTILDHNYLFGRIDMEHYQYETCKLWGISQ